MFLLAFGFVRFSILHPVYSSELEEIRAQEKLDQQNKRSNMEPPQKLK
jgi:hypothetical protein